ncbi:MAG: CvpA family protein [Ruminiclostridium sp.]|nr:CvpA family protein [Ruminiclostridium sp.]
MSNDEYGQRKRTSTDKIPLIMLLVFLAGIIILDLVFKFGLNWVDYLIIGVIFFSAFIGYIKGLISAIFSLVGYVVAAVCAVLFSEPLAKLIMEKTQISKTVEEALTNVYSGIPAFSQQTLDLNSFTNSNQFLQKYPQLQQFLGENMMFGQLFESVNPLKAGADAISSAISSIADLLVFSILKVISIIIVFFVVKLIVIIVGKLVNTLISQSNFLNTTNKTIGLALGVVIGCVVVFVAVSYIIPFVGSMNIIKIPDEYGQSQVLSWIFTSPPAS